MVEPMSAASMPSAVRSLLPLAREWGISDDIERSMKVESASLKELRDLVSQVDSAGEVVYGWLDASAVDPPDPDYTAITSLTMAVDEARVILRSGER
jgi:hypothetical protein